MNKKIGNMDVKRFDVLNGNLNEEVLEVTNLGQNPYMYDLLNFGTNATYSNDMSMRCCLYVFECGQNGILINDRVLQQEECFLGNVKILNIVSDSKAVVFLAYFAKDIDKEDTQIFPLHKAKKVDKPWGYEIWLTGDPSELFAFKKIYIKSGNKTSLQYHKIKRETNFIIDGTAALYFDNNGFYFSDRELAISSVNLTGPFTIDVFPNTIHRLEALSDLTLFEVSTPELDDVIRLQDDSGRKHGRVSDEH